MIFRSPVLLGELNRVLYGDALSQSRILTEKIGKPSYTSSRYTASLVNKYSSP